MLIGTGLAAKICVFRDLWLLENPGFGAGLTFAAPLGSGRVIRQSLRLGETTGLAAKICVFRDLWLPEILDDRGRRRAAKPLGSPMELAC
ncbi:hypothetical protein DdX_18499 [Ditylenchus destructor]|uniref:Uncharacterized protein n=1 Tax=Ditylenchus destructor TaxID=166010 RepID=A0AAD4MJP6_9BILA|nr:hypothetical protein DdX_18499 [Ditylenchus destructor]